MVSCTHIRVFISSKMNLGKMYLTKRKKNYIYRYIYLKHLLYKAFTLLQGLTWLWVLATYWIDQGETEAMNDVILGLEGRKMKLSQKKKNWVMSLRFWWRSNCFQATRSLLPKRRTVHNDGKSSSSFRKQHPPIFFLFCFICHTTHPL